MHGQDTRKASDLCRMLSFTQTEHATCMCRCDITIRIKKVCERRPVYIRLVAFAICSKTDVHTHTRKDR